MVAAALQTPLPVSRALASDRETGDFRTAFEKCAPSGGYVSGGNPAVDTVTTIVQDAAALANVSGDTTGKTIGFALAGQSGVPGAGQNFGTAFGMGIGGYSGWWYSGGGEAVMAAAVAAQGVSDIIVRLGGLRSGEAGGWWKEPITHEKLVRGKYATGDQINLRLFGDAQKIMNRAYPNVVTPAASAGVSALNDWIGGTFNALEFGQPENDAFSGLFPTNVDDSGGALDEVKLAGSIIENGAKVYYLSAWWQPTFVTDYWFNKTWYDALSADDKLRIDTACIKSAMINQGLSNFHQGFMVNQFKALGVSVQASWPADVLNHLRSATEEIYEEEEAADGTGAYTLLQDSKKVFVKDEQVWLNHYPGDIAARWRAGFDLWRTNTPLG